MRKLSLLLLPLFICTQLFAGAPDMRISDNDGDVLNVNSDGSIPTTTSEGGFNATKYDTAPDGTTSRLKLWIDPTDPSTMTLRPGVMVSGAAATDYLNVADSAAWDVSDTDTISIVILHNDISYNSSNTQGLDQAWLAQRSDGTAAGNGGWSFSSAHNSSERGIPNVVLSTASDSSGTDYSIDADAAVLLSYPQYSLVGVSIDVNQATALDRVLFYGDGTLIPASNYVVDSGTAPTSLFNSTNTVYIGRLSDAFWAAEDVFGLVLVYEARLTAAQHAEIWNDGDVLTCPEIRASGTLNQNIIVCQDFTNPRRGTASFDALSYNDSTSGITFTVTGNPTHVQQVLSIKDKSPLGISFNARTVRAYLQPFGTVGDICYACAPQLITGVNGLPMLRFWYNNFMFAQANTQPNVANWGGTGSGDIFEVDRPFAFDATSDSTPPASGEFFFLSTSLSTAASDTYWISMREFESSIAHEDFRLEANDTGLGQNKFFGVDFQENKPYLGWLRAIGYGDSASFEYKYNGNASSSITYPTENSKNVWVDRIYNVSGSTDILCMHGLYRGGSMSTSGWVDDVGDIVVYSPGLEASIGNIINKELADKWGLTLAKSSNTYPNYSVSTYGAGSNYPMTATATAVSFGTTSPSLTISLPGTYELSGHLSTKFTSATYASEDTVLAKFRRTNNTAADVTSGTITTTTPRMTVVSTGSSVVIPTVEYTTTQDNDAISIFGNVGKLPEAGFVSADSSGTWIRAKLKSQ